jgi:hypothetical protein
MGGANILGGIFGGSAAAAEAEKAERIINDSIARINALQIPDITKKIIYDQYMSVGNFTPDMLDKVIEENAPLSLVKEDPRYRAKMQSSLAQLEQRTKGLSAEGELALEKSRRRTSQDVLAQLASIESEAKRRGTLSSGGTLASKLKAVQAGADRQSMGGLEAAALAEKSSSQNLENFIRSLSADEQTRLEVQGKNVQARNLRDEQLMRNAIAREQYNKEAANRANLRNLDERQRAFDANTGISIGEQRRVGYEAPMKMFDMNLGKTNALNSMYGKLADVYTGRGQNKAQMWSSLASGAGQMAAGAFDGNAFKTTGGGNTGTKIEINYPGMLAPGGGTAPVTPTAAIPPYEQPMTGYGGFSNDYAPDYAPDSNYSFGSFNRNKNYRSPFGFNY